jgi:CBS-domain-containing membrane protein
MKNYLAKMSGGKTCPKRAPLSEIFWSMVGGFAGIVAIYLLGRYQGIEQKESLFLIGSFGASAVLLYGTPASPYAQPRNLIGGHFLSALSGVTAYHFFPHSVLFAASIGVAIAIALMHFTRTLHPPGGATALIAVIGGYEIHELGYWYAITPVVLGAIIMLMVALLVNNLSSERRYPQYWF